MRINMASKSFQFVKCRLCTKPTLGNVISLFTEFKGTIYSEKIEEILHIKLAQTPSKSNIMCPICFALLKKIIGLRNFLVHTEGENRCVPKSTTDDAPEPEPSSFRKIDFTVKKQTKKPRKPRLSIIKDGYGNWKIVDLPPESQKAKLSLQDNPRLPIDTKPNESPVPDQLNPKEFIKCKPMDSLLGRSPVQDLEDPPIADEGNEDKRESPAHDVPVLADDEFVLEETIEISEVDFPLFEDDLVTYDPIDEDPESESEAEVEPQWAPLRRIPPQPPKPRMTQEEKEHLIGVMVEMGLFICNVCGKDCGSFRVLNQHILEHPNPEKYLFCCHYSVNRGASSLFDHIRWHQDKDAFKCKDCDKRYKERIYLSEHVRKVHSPKWVCEDCGVGFAQPYKLELHRRSKHLDVRVPCKYCGVELRESSLKNHIKETHELEVNYLCDLCGRGFYSQARLGLHMNDHGGPHGGNRRKKPKIICEQDPFDSTYFSPATPQSS